MPTRTRVDDGTLRAQAQTLADRLIERRMRLVTAESCTGGWIAKTLTDLPGSSAWFDGGVVSYSNAAKQALLGVDESILSAYGAVSEQCACAMAVGARDRFDADLAVAVTGIAGPDGGSPDKPVGTVWIAWQRRDAPVRAKRFVFAGDREAVRRQTVIAALAGVLEQSGTGPG